MCHHLRTPDATSRRCKQKLASEVHTFLLLLLKTYLGR